MAKRTRKNDLTDAEKDRLTESPKRVFQSLVASRSLDTDDVRVSLPRADIGP
jgi:hypothetical protein